MNPKALFPFLISYIALFGTTALPREVGDPKAAFVSIAQNVSSIRLGELQSLEGWWIYRTAVMPSNQELGAASTSPLKIEVGVNEVVFIDRVAGMQLKFQISERNLVLKEAMGRAAELLHYSKSNTQTASFLWRDIASGNLVTLLISRQLPVVSSPPQKPTFAFEFPNGARWREKQVELSLCGFRQKILKDAVHRAIAQWQVALKDKLSIRVTEIESNFPPYSDLNRNCIYWIDGYKMTDNIKIVHGGASLGLPSPDGLALVSSDIFLFSSEFLKYNFTSLIDFAKGVETVALHEVGHFLGLAHPFDKNVPSVMNYQDRDTLTDYDLKALHSLYK